MVTRHVALTGRSKPNGSRCYAPSLGYCYSLRQPAEEVENCLLIGKLVSRAAPPRVTDANGNVVRQQTESFFVAGIVTQVDSEDVGTVDLVIDPLRRSALVPVGLRHDIEDHLAAAERKLRPSLGGALNRAGHQIQIVLSHFAEMQARREPLVFNCCAANVLEFGRQLFAQPFEVGAALHGRRIDVTKVAAEDFSSVVAGVDDVPQPDSLMQVFDGASAHHG